MKSLANNSLAIFLCFAFILLSFLSSEGLRWDNLRYSGIAITSDELSHIPCGYYYLKTGRYFLNPEHPPLVKDIAALPLLFIKPYFPNISDNNLLKAGYAWDYYPYASYEFSRNLELINDQWDWGRIFLFRSENDPDVIAFWARLSVIVFNAIFLFILYIFVAKLWNKRSAIISLFLIVFSQFSLAHSSLVTMDFMSAVLQMIAIASFSIHLKKHIKHEGSAKFFALAAIFSALALLAKDTSPLIFLPMFFGGLGYVIYRTKSFQEIFRFLLRFTSLGLATAIIVTMYYLTHTFNMDENETLIHLAYHYPNNFNRLGLDIMASLIISNPITKALAVYFEGLLMVFQRLDTAYQSTYFLGKTYIDRGASRLYFPILFLTKLQIGLLILIIFALLNKTYKFLKKKLEANIDVFTTILILFLATFFVISISSNLQIGLRHIMPVIFSITLFTAKFIDDYWGKLAFKSLRYNFAFMAIFLWMIISVLYAFPNYISYYNELGGGTKNGYNIAVDSNYDWGQDVKGLVEWVEENNISKVYGHIGTGVPLKWYLGDRYEEFNIEKMEIPQSGSFVVVSIGEYQKNITKEGIGDEKKYEQFNNELIGEIGKTLRIFQIP